MKWELRAKYGTTQSSLPVLLCSALISVSANKLAGSFLLDFDMKRIKLTQGQYALVDNEDYERLNQYKWFAIWSKDPQSFYANRDNKGKKPCNVSMAREILGLEYNNRLQADHINHNTLDNRRANLRAVTHQQNHFNRKNIKGYSWRKFAKKYRAKITLNGKQIYLGYFSTTEDAHNAYLQAKKQYHKIDKERECIAV